VVNFSVFSVSDCFEVRCLGLLRALSDLSKKSYLTSVDWLKSDIMGLVGGVLVIICGVLVSFYFLFLL
jgi:hypothetical protein